jgi:predicted transposase YdaD
LHLSSLLQADEQLNQLETVLAFFATFVLDSTLFQQIMRWDMTVLRESPWYQEILHEGEMRGEQRGEERGERRGIISSIEMTLEMKFGSDGLQLMPQMAQISDLSSLKVVLRNVIAANTVEEVQRLI